MIIIDLIEPGAKLILNNAYKQKKGNMMKNNKITRKVLVGLTLTFAFLGAAACGTDSTPVDEVPNILETSVPVATHETLETSEEAVSVPTDLTIVDEEGNTSIDLDTLEASLSSASSSDLTNIEAEGLVFMREEEKLARDVYLTLYDQWNINIFKNIAASEQTHTDAIKTLLDQYGLDDPMSSDEIGVFENADLQALYDQLAALGSQSLADALNVGAAIEEIDILDLEKYIAQTDNSDIQRVYESLLKGSRNHLRSFVNTMSNQIGTTYQPQYLSQDAYQAIVGTDIETGSNGRGKGYGNG
jgi:hypothetical protein